MDTFIGGAGRDFIDSFDEDVFAYDLLADLPQVVTNVTNVSAGVFGDAISGFTTNVDDFEFLSSEFDPSATIGLGSLAEGANFSTISSVYDGTNGTSTEFLAGKASFIVDITNTLYYDPDGTAAGYRVVADTIPNQVAATDIDIVASV